MSGRKILGLVLLSESSVTNRFLRRYALKIKEYSDFRYPQYVFMVILPFVLFIFSALVSASDLDDAKKVAQQGYLEYVALCVQDMQSKIDFQLDASDNLGNATLGTPIELVELNPVQILSYSHYSDIDYFITPLSIFLFPVKFRQKTKLLLKVIKFDGEKDFEIIEIGDAPVAREIQKIQHVWSESRKYRIILGVNFQTMRYAFSIPDINTDNLTILYPSSTLESNTDYTALTSLAQTIQFLRNELLPIVNN